MSLVPRRSVTSDRLSGVLGQKDRPGHSALRPSCFPLLEGGRGGVQLVFSRFKVVKLWGYGGRMRPPQLPLSGLLVEKTPRCAGLSLAATIHSLCRLTLNPIPTPPQLSLAFWLPGEGTQKPQGQASHPKCSSLKTKMLPSRKRKYFAERLRDHRLPMASSAWCAKEPSSKLRELQILADPRPRPLGSKPV